MDINRDERGPGDEAESEDERSIIDDANVDNTSDDSELEDTE
jgi:hypothetical protein